MALAGHFLTTPGLRAPRARPMEVLLCTAAAAAAAAVAAAAIASFDHPTTLDTSSRRAAAFRLFLSLFPFLVQRRKT